MSDELVVGRIRGKHISELSDSELKAEARRRRAGREGDRERDGEPAASRGVISPGRTRQYLANLGLRVDAGFSEIEKAYRELSQKYDPSQFADDDKKKSVAEKLRGQLTEAYDGLREALEDGKPDSDD